MRTLVLNSGFEPMLLVNWERAICLVLSDKAEVIAAYNQCIRTVSQAFPLPSVIKLNQYVKLVRRFGVVRCTRRNILLRDRHQCQYCGIKCNPSLATIDHVIPRSQGGLTTWENVVVSCPNCNRRKGAKALELSGMRLLKTPRQPSWHELMGELDYPIEKAWLEYLDLAS